MKKNVGIVTSARELNYGAILQAFALQESIRKRGFSPTLLWWNNQNSSHHDIRWKKILGMLKTYCLHPGIFFNSMLAYKQAFKKEYTKESQDMFQSFEEQNLSISFFTYDEMKDYAYSNDCKAVVAGSDQIWNSYAVYIDPFYYLRFAPYNKRIAYAPSLGKDKIPSYNVKKMKCFIGDFPFLSVRENSGKDLIKQLIKKEVPVVLDPSFLLEREEWVKKENHMEVSSSYILLYFLDEPDVNTIKTIKKYVVNKNLPVISIPFSFDSLKSIGNIRFVDAGPSEFLYLVNHAETVLTDSFHGTAFSINLKTNFHVFSRQYGNNQPQASRITDLLGMFDLMSRYITSGDIESPEISESQWNSINEVLKEKRLSSNDYLSKALEE